MRELPTEFCMRKKRFNLLNEFLAVVFIFPFSWCFLGGASANVVEIGLPVNVETASIGSIKVKREFQGCLFMLKKDIGAQDTKPVGTFIISESLSGFQEGALKFYSSAVKFLSLSSAFAEEMGKQGREERSDNTQNKSYDETSRVQFFSLILGYLMGLISSCTGIFLYYRYL